MITALTITVPLALVALAVVVMRLNRRREDRAIREMDEAIRPFSDRPDFADWADELREPS